MNDVSKMPKKRLRLRMMLPIRTLPQHRQHAGKLSTDPGTLEVLRLPTLQIFP